MKKTLALLLTLAMVLALAACGSGNAKKDEAAATEEPKSEDVQTAEETKDTEEPEDAEETKEEEKTDEKEEAADIDWPTSDIEVVVPYNPGGDTDTYARAMLDGLSDILGVTVSITNMTGSSGAVAAEYVQNAEPDGNTVLFWHSSILTNKIFGNVDYSYEAYENANILVQNGSYFVFSSPKFGSFEELVSYAKEHPGEVVAGGTNGGFNYLATVVLQGALDIEFKYVDCTSAGDAAVEIMAGRMDVFLTMLPAMQDYVESGDVNILACVGAERSEAAPDVPTLVEMGYDDIKIQQTYGYQFPKGTDQAIIDKWNDACAQVVATDAYKEINDGYGSVVATYYGQDATDVWAQEMEYYMGFEKYFLW